MTQDKASIRIKSQERRKSILALEKRFNSEKIVERILKKEQFMQAMVIMMYIPTDYEPDIHPLIEKAQSLGKTVCIPLCRQDKQMLAVVPDDWSALPVNCYGIGEPKEGEYTVIEPGEIDMVIVPGIAFDSQCNRLGHGAGYYDRFLSKCRPDAVKVGVCFETQVYKEIPADDTDVPMDLLVTDITTYKRIP
ncbi:MAG: 5-formyltetrahydrofolate cyclo-ligase [Bacillota bacterium]